jgi:hypothetical protein
MHCPACRKFHRWQRKDAWVDAGNAQNRSPPLGENDAVLRNRERRRAALARASTLLQGLTSCLNPLVAESVEPDPVAEALQILFDWVEEERERAMPHSIRADGTRDDHA